MKKKLTMYGIWAGLGMLFVLAMVSVWFVISVYDQSVWLKLKLVDVPPLVSYTGATLKTNYGDIDIVFLKNRAPNTVKNFIKLARAGFFNGTKFHRVVTDFMIQGGDPLTRNNALKAEWGHGGPGYEFADEIHQDDQMATGSVAMVNNGPNTNGSQFFILTSEIRWLEGRNTIFAKVTKGLDVATLISKVPTNVLSIPDSDVLLQEVILK